ncbi:tail fiber domain-containing protein [Shewanella goraebulensis]|uniref:tail fiber domain-containing protein n=1 Tax=Shewanella goraebulensis TaxID=3050637 RepID=UPI00254EF010|nr:tail fiber domain-containing protein [Shewanella goraebulensis]
MKITKYSALAFLSLPVMMTNSAVADNQILDDLIVTQSACIGQDCVNGESFGFDTLRLKENNLRIKFQDTSTSASFPSNDWQITANDSENGGANKFSIDDVTGSKTPFTIEASAPSHSLYVDASGSVGLGTSNPIVEMHVVNGDSPTLRLEQNGSSGFTAQTWDLAGNETNFFVRDVSNGSKLPFKIMPNAPTNSLVVSASGNVGIGDQTPDAALDIESGNVKITNGVLEVANSSSSYNTTLINLERAGASRVTFKETNTSYPSDWQLSNFQQTFVINEKTNDGLPEFTLDEDGNLTLKGQVTANNVLLTSDVNKKENFLSVDSTAILNAIAQLSISKWNYKSESENTQHIGPMAQQFYDLFGLGDSEKHISAIDSAGVSLAAAKALLELNNQKEKKIADLEQRLEKLEKALN